MEMEMRAAEDIAMAEDLTPPLLPLVFSLYDSFLSSHCSSCSLPLPTPPFTPTFPPNYSHVPTLLYYCSPLCSSLDSPLHFSSAEPHLLRSPSPPSHPDSANLRLSLRLLHLFAKGNKEVVSLERIGGLITNYRKLMMAEEEDEVSRMIKDGAEAMVVARRMGEGSDSVVEDGGLLEEAILCLVMMNAVEVQEKNGRPIGVAIYDAAFSWINHSCSPNACYRFSTASSEIGGEPRFLIFPATMGNGGGAESLNNTNAHSKFEFFKGNGPRIIIRSIKGIEKGEGVTIAYTDLLQPKTTRQSELWSKYRFSCCCKRCSAVPATYVDRVLQESPDHDKEEIEELTVFFDDAIAEYISMNNTESCCKKLESLLIDDGHIKEQLQPKNREIQRNSKLNLLHHLSLDAYTILASGYKVLAFDLLALSSGNDKFQMEAFDKIRASAAYSLLLAVLTHHLFLSESSLIASVANYWGSAGESLLSVARSSVWEKAFQLAPAVSESSSILNHECYRSPQLNRYLFNSFCSQDLNRSPQLNRYLFNSFCSQDQIAEFDKVNWQFQNFIADSLVKMWSFLTYGGSFLEQINDLDFRRFLTKEAPFDSEATLTIETSKGKRNISGSESQPSNQLRGILFQLGVHCLLYGACLSRICYGQHSELASDAMNFLHSQGIFAESVNLHL